MRENLLLASGLLAGRTQLSCQDYQEVLSRANAQDVVYMDPPYQGVCTNRDQRYIGGVDFDSFVEGLSDLNRRDVSFIVSYDGRTGDKVYGKPLPRSLKLHHLEFTVGRSTQATLLGRDDETVESLYISNALLDRLDGLPSGLGKREPMLFES
jgi:DNA adenine methylase